MERIAGLPAASDPAQSPRLALVAALGLNVRTRKSGRNAQPRRGQVSVPRPADREFLAGPAPFPVFFRQKYIARSYRRPAARICSDPGYEHAPGKYAVDTPSIFRYELAG